MQASGAALADTVRKQKADTSSVRQRACMVRNFRIIYIRIVGGLRKGGGLSAGHPLATSSALAGEASQCVLEWGIGQFPLQFVQRCTGGGPELPPGGKGLWCSGGDLHSHTNSSNLATPCLEKGNKFSGDLPQFGSYSTVGRSNDHGMLSELDDLATMPQGSRNNGLIVPLQCGKTGSLASKISQFLARLEEFVQAGQVH